MENWKPIPGFAFLEASNLGRIRTLPHQVMTAKGYYLKVKGQTLKLMPKSTGYLCVTVRNPDPNGKVQTQALVHRLVCLAFRGLPDDPKEQALHWDDDGHNNNEANLYWGTSKQNMADRKRNGNFRNGSKLTKEQIAEIRLRYRPRCKDNGAKAMAREFGVHHTSIENAYYGRTFG